MRFNGCTGGEGDTIRAGDCIFLHGNGNRSHQLGTGFFVHYRLGSAVKGVEFVSDRMSYIVLRGRWCNIIVSNVHATCEEKSELGISLHQDSNGNGNRVVNFTTSKNLVVNTLPTGWSFN